MKKTTEAKKITNSLNRLSNRVKMTGDRISEFEDLSIEFSQW